jgi:predicted nucleic acid-binding protein
MSIPFLDTNILIRHITKDDPVRSPAAFALLQGIERGQISVWTTELVVAEAIFILTNRRTYNRSRENIRSVLLPILLLPGIKLANKRVYPRAFDLWVSLPDLSYVDAYHAARIEREASKALYSFDADFDKIPGLVRREPQLSPTEPGEAREP